MALGRGSTEIKKPKKFFEDYKKANPSKIDFGETTVQSRGVYRRRFHGKDSLFWLILKIGFVVFLISVMIAVIKGLFFH